MIRAIVERLSRGVVLKRRLPVDLGGMALFVSPDSSLKYWKTSLRDTDPVLLNAARLLVKPADVVWDVGANVGLFSFASAGLVGASGRVLAIEPDPWLSELLRKSSRLKENEDRSVEVLSVAVGERNGIVDLNIAERGRATNFVSGNEPSSQTGGVRNVVTVIAITLDWLLDFWPAPSVIKIDVEGAEVSVLRGAERLLREVRPKIMCEVSLKHQDEATAIFKTAGYAIYNAEFPLLGSPQISKCSWNTIALHDDSGLDTRATI